MSLHNHHLVPRFPPELEARCFKLAARTYREICPTLLLVAFRVCQWIQPIVYETVDFQGSETRFLAFLRVLEMKHPQFHHCVKHLDLYACFALNEERLAFLSRLPYLVDLAVRGDYSKPPAQFVLSHAISQLKLQRLILESPASQFSLLCIFRTSLPLPPISYSLTHLCLLSPTSFLPTRFIEYLPALTHFAVQAVYDLVHLATGAHNGDWQLHLLERLSVVAIICLSQEELDLMTKFLDHRNVSRDKLVFLLPTPEFFVDFDVSSTWGWRKQDDIWEEADRILESRVGLSHSS